MAQTKTHPKIKSIACEFAKNLKEQKLTVEKIILFGSYARGNARKDSDLDLVIISPDFDSIDFWKRIELLAQARTNYDFAIDYFGLGAKEYKSTRGHNFIGEIKKKGKQIYP